jgi:pilus assembly protein CpaB
MLKPGLLLPLGATVAGAAAAATASHYLRDQVERSERAVQQRYATQNIVVASRDLPKGQVLDSTVLAIRPIPKTFVSTDAVSPARAAELIGKRTVIGMAKGTPVVPSALNLVTSTRLSETLPRGERALTIQVDQVNAVGGHLGAGDTVDLYYSQREQSGAVLVPLLQHIHVLATGTTTEQPGETADTDFSTVTLQVNSEQAAKLVLAEQTGRVTLLLRARDDEAPTEISIRDSRQLLRPAAPGVGEALHRQQLIEVLTGGQGGAEPARSWLKVGRNAGGAITETT